MSSYPSPSLVIDHLSEMLAARTGERNVYRAALEDIYIRLRDRPRNTVFGPFGLGEIELHARYALERFAPLDKL